MRLRPFLITAVLAIIAWSGWSQPPASTHTEAEQLWRSALAAQQNQQYDRAISIYKQILTIEPDLLEAEVNLGLMYQVRGDVPAAIAAFSRVLKKAPDLYPPNLLTGLDYLKEGKPDLSFSYLEKAVVLKPEDVRARLGFANSNLQLRRYPMAANEFKKATELDPKSADAWYGLGASYLSLERQAESRLRHTRNVFRTLLLAEADLDQGQQATAVKLFKAAIADDPHIPCSHSLLGFAYLASGLILSAEPEFRIDWNQQSGCLLGKLGLGAIAARQNQSATAVEEVKGAAEIDSSAASAAIDLIAPYVTEARQIIAQSSSPGEAAGKSPRSLFDSGRYSACTDSLGSRQSQLQAPELKLLAACAYYSGKYMVAMQASGSLLKSDPDDSEALYWDIRSFERLGVLSLATATDINPDSVSLHTMYADMLRSKGSFDQAAEEYRRAITLNPSFLPAHLGLAKALYWNNNREQAAAELNIVLKTDSTDPAANYVMGEILLADREFKQAVPFLTAGLKGAPEERPHVHAALSKAYDQEGDLSRAISELKQSLMADTDGSYHYRLARLLEKAGDHSAAAQAMAQSRQLRLTSDAPNAQDGQ